jgi:S1-C subfamily serine protease
VPSILKAKLEAAGFSVIADDEDHKRHGFRPLPNNYRVHVVGHPVGFWWTYSSGYVSNTWSDIEGPEPMRGQMLQVSAPVWNGNSGGGAFDEKGHLIGIASWISKAGPQLSFFVHRDVIIKFMKVHDR